MNLGNSLLKNWLSLLGIVVSLGALFTFVLLFAVDLLWGHAGPYFGLLAYVVVPGAFVGGLCLMVLGFLLWYWLNYREKDATGCWAWLKLKAPDVKADFSHLSTWIVLVCLLAALGVSASVVTLAGYKVYHWTEEDEFCGELCHVTMEPENVAHQTSPHAKIQCVECHVGPGLEAYAYAKINGIRQLAQNLTGTYHTPIHVPVAALYGRHLDGKTKIEHTCLECHWSDQYVGAKDKTFVHFLKNEEDAKATIRMSLKVGGNDPKAGPVGGIHSHITAAGKKVEFVTENNKREGKVSWVRQTSEKGEVTVYARDGFKFDEAKQKVFTMTCLECHNRPAHQYASPVTAVDLAMELGTLPLELGDSVKYTVIDLLTGDYKTQEEAIKAISEGLNEYFPDSEHLALATQTVQDIYKRNFFPRMKANWAAYPDHIGHKESEGCARCHNGELTDEKEGQAIRNGCQDCHQIIAQQKGEEWDEADVKGLEFKHPDGNDQDDITTCSKCHNGTY